VIAGGSMLSYGALGALHDAGLRIPHDVALVTCDGWRSPGLFEPRPIVVERDAVEIGRVAAELLLEGVLEGTHRSVTLPVRVVDEGMRG
jgi:LacI family transcriptional regulator